MHTLRAQNTVLVTQSAEPTHCTMSTTMLKRDLGTGDLCDNIGLIGVLAKWSYVTASPSHHDQAIPILSPLLFMHVDHPYIPLFKGRRIFDLLVWKFICHVFKVYTMKLHFPIHFKCSPCTACTYTYFSFLLSPHMQL